MIFSPYTTSNENIAYPFLPSDAIAYKDQGIPDGKIPTNFLVDAVFNMDTDSLKLIATGSYPPLSWAWLILENSSSEFLTVMLPWNAEPYKKWYPVYFYGASTIVGYILPGSGYQAYLDAIALQWIEIISSPLYLEPSTIYPGTPAVIDFELPDATVISPDNGIVKLQAGYNIGLTLQSVEEAKTGDSLLSEFEAVETGIEAEATPGAGEGRVPCDQEPGSPVFEGTATNIEPSNTRLEDSTASWVAGDLVGMIVKNTTDGSYGMITANTVTTVTAVLSSGVTNLWNAADSYIVLENQYLRRLSGAAADASGNVVLRTDECYRVEPDLIDMHALTITGDCKACCECEDYYDALTYLRKQFNYGGQLAVSGLPAEYNTTPQTLFIEAVDEGDATLKYERVGGYTLHYRQDCTLKNGGVVYSRWEYRKNGEVKYFSTATTNVAAPLGVLWYAYASILYSGHHAGTGEDENILYDPAASFPAPDGLIGQFVRKTGDPTLYPITSNTATTITATGATWNYAEPYEVIDTYGRIYKDVKYPGIAPEDVDPNLYYVRPISTESVQPVKNANVYLYISTTLPVGLWKAKGIMDGLHSGNKESYSNSVNLWNSSSISTGSVSASVTAWLTVGSRRMNPLNPAEELKDLSGFNHAVLNVRALSLISNTEIAWVWAGPTANYRSIRDTYFYASNNFNLMTGPIGPLSPFARISILRRTSGLPGSAWAVEFGMAHYSGPSSGFTGSELTVTAGGPTFTLLPVQASDLGGANMQLDFSDGGSTTLQFKASGGSHRWTLTIGATSYYSPLSTAPLTMVVGGTTYYAFPPPWLVEGAIIRPAITNTAYAEVGTYVGEAI